MSPLFPTNLCPWNVLTTNEQCRPPAYKDYLFLMCSVIAAHLPDPANVVATAVQCENLNGATSLCLIIEALVCVSWFGWYTCRMLAIYPLTPRLSHFFMFFFSLNTCFKMLQSGCWLLLCFSPSLSSPFLLSLYLSHVNCGWFICGMN